MNKNKEEIKKLGLKCVNFGCNETATAQKYGEK